MAEILDPLTLPLHGSRLIEASAGTGKTWTVAALVLRLVLGHGGANGFARPLAPAEILVMTFTRAATRELAERIRERLIEAARVFRGEAEPAGHDQLLAGLLEAYAAEPEREAAAWRLDSAARCMDEAAVHTIDAWCQRMLREHAFDSGSLFDEELAADEQELLRQAVRDFWRQQVYALDGQALGRVLGVWPDVDRLGRDMAALRRHELPPPGADGLDLGQLVARLEAARAADLARLKPGWGEGAAAMRAWLNARLAEKDCVFDKRPVHPRYYGPWLDTLAAWADDATLEALALTDKALFRLTPQGLVDAFKPGRSVDLPPFFAEFEGLCQALAALPDLGSALRLHAAAAVSLRMAQLQEQAGRFGFADLLRRLDAALDPARNGAAAARLRQRIRAQYPVALVDEFQDTSPIQARIFGRLYDIGANDPTSALLLIGDPKQSIYAFRGADIRSYLQARHATAGRHYMLGTNHRSAAALVQAVNHVFESAEQRPGEGAFLFRSAGTPAAEGELPFVPVAARGRAERFLCRAGPPAPLQFELDAELVDARLARRRFAGRCAEHIVTLLNDAGAGFEEPGKAFRRLRPADIAVLVRTGAEAELVRLELRRRGVASVYLSDKDSVFASDEALDLLRWLRAVAAPGDARLVRAALATRSTGLALGELARLAADEEAFDARCEQLRALQRVWQNQGVLAMLRRSLHALGLPARWLAEGDGERRLTNFMHLAELLQTAAATLEGEPALIRWFAGRVAGDDDSAGDDKILRLESDADLVKVATIHKSKGLEYPLVFLPFPCLFRAVSRKNTRALALFDETSGRHELVLKPSDEQMQAADQERLREDLRLLYVALTRARHFTWAGLAAVGAGRKPVLLWSRSAIGHLLLGAEAGSVDGLAARLAGVLQPCAEIGLHEAAATVSRSRLAAREAPPALRDTPEYAAVFERQWSVGSFSALVRSLPAPELWAGSVAAVRDDEIPLPVEGAGDGERAPATDPGRGAAWHRFARGALAGNFLHEQLEWLAGEGFDLGAAEVQNKLLRRCERQGWGARGPELLEWLGRLVTTPLPGPDVALAGLDRPLPEMEFWFPSRGLEAGALDALCRRHLLPGHERPALAERQLRGMVMGFADLVFEHGGRYWVLDYKSNHLGPGDADYAAPALQAAMAEHRYDVQAALYLLALHRLLRSRLGAGYDPQQHLGGALYLFLRGIEAPGHGVCLITAPQALLDGLEAALGPAPAGEAR